MKRQKKEKGDTIFFYKKLKPSTIIGAQPSGNTDHTTSIGRISLIYCAIHVNLLYLIIQCHFRHG